MAGLGSTYAELLKAIGSGGMGETELEAYLGDNLYARYDKSVTQTFTATYEGSILVNKKNLGHTAVFTPTFSEGGSWILKSAVIKSINSVTENGVAQDTDVYPLLINIVDEDAWIFNVVSGAALNSNVDYSVDIECTFEINASLQRATTRRLAERITVLEESNESSGGVTLDKIQSIDTWYTETSELEADDSGIKWKDDIGIAIDDDEIITRGTYRVPIIAGDNISFEITDDGYFVKINATGGLEIGETEGTAYEGSKGKKLADDFGVLVQDVILPASVMLEAHETKINDFDTRIVSLELTSGMAEGLIETVQEHDSEIAGITGMVESHIETIADHEERISALEEGGGSSSGGGGGLTKEDVEAMFVGYEDVTQKTAFGRGVEAMFDAWDYEQETESAFSMAVQAIAGPIAYSEAWNVCSDYMSMYGSLSVQDCSDLEGETIGKEIYNGNIPIWLESVIYEFSSEKGRNITLAEKLASLGGGSSDGGMTEEDLAAWLERNMYYPMPSDGFNNALAVWAGPKGLIGSAQHPDGGVSLIVYNTDISASDLICGMTDNGPVKISDVYATKEELANVGGSSGGGVENATTPSQIAVTHSELKQLRDSGQLIPGMFYRITDYVCTTVQENTRAMDHKFDIIVQALSNCTLSENASADYNADDTYFCSRALNVTVHYNIMDDADGNTVKTEEGALYVPTDKFVSYDYVANNEGVVVPVLYKTDIDGYPGETDLGDAFFYVGTYEYNGTTYDRWRKIELDGDYTWDADEKCYVLTDIIVQDNKLIESKIFGGVTKIANLSAWELKYCLDNDTSKFAWADAGSGKGVIYYMKDEHGNECPYDFKNIQFHRDWEDEKYASFIETNNWAGIQEWFYTFSWLNDNYEVEDLTMRQDLLNDEGCESRTYNNKISECYNYYGNTYVLGNNVFIDSWYVEGGLFYGCYDNTFGSRCTNNTFGPYCCGNTLGCDCHNNVLISNNRFNTFSNGCDSNHLDFGCDGNTFGQYCANNTLCDWCQSNTFGSSCNSNRMVSPFEYAYIETGCGSIVLGTEGSGTTGRNIRICQGINYTSIDCVSNTTYRASNSQEIILE
jgi:hypothetical protein